MNKKLILISCLLLLILCTAAFAGDKPLSLQESIPADGASGIAVDVSIVLTFSNNVVNMKVTENNRSCFSLLDNSGNEVETEVYFPDDQIEPENKRVISLIPCAPLSGNMNYTVVISPELMSKNGSHLEKEVRIGFKTAP